MRFIAWDTSSKTASLVAMNGNRIVAQKILSTDLAHSERLLWGIDQILGKSRIRLDDIDYLGVGVGPGSFTGLRIGLTTARTLADALQRPLVGVSSLLALARPVAERLKKKYPEALVIAARDACKGELFAFFADAKSVADKNFQPEERTFSPEELIESLLTHLQDQKRKWIVVGDGRSMYLEAWKKLPQRSEMKLTSLKKNLIQPRYLGELVKEAFELGRAQDALKVFPEYLRVSDAELKLKARQSLQRV